MVFDFLQLVEFAAEGLPLFVAADGVGDDPGGEEGEEGEAFGDDAVRSGCQGEEESCHR